MWSWGKDTKSTIQCVMGIIFFSQSNQIFKSKQMYYANLQLMVV